MILPDRKAIMERPLLSQRERPFRWRFSTEGRKELRYVEGAGKRVAPGEGGDRAEAVKMEFRYARIEGVWEIFADHGKNLVRGT